VRKRQRTAVAEGIAGGEEARARLTPSPSPIGLERVAPAKAITIRIPQLKDCKNHFDKAKGKGKGTMVFLCEGQPARCLRTATMRRATVAVRKHFTLKGKPLIVWDLKRDIVYKNDEMYNLMRALDIEDNIERLRYDKVILATDADVDGLHIRKPRYLLVGLLQRIRRSGLFHQRLGKIRLVCWRNDL
jgi:topoisomerase-4 subunit B